MNEIINFNYEGNEIPFRIDENGEVFMNTTKMMDSFPGKRVQNFTRLQSTIDFINVLHEEKDVAPISVSTESPLIQKIIGKGKPQGTWMHEDLALEFAQWLNPKFKLWCTRRIKEIITKGFSAKTEEATEYVNAEIGIEIEMINDIVKLLHEKKNKKPGELIKDFMRFVDGDTAKIRNMVNVIHKKNNKVWDLEDLLDMLERNCLEFLEEKLAILFKKTKSYNDTGDYESLFEARVLRAIDKKRKRVIKYRKTRNERKAEKVAEENEALKAKIAKYSYSREVKSFRQSLIKYANDIYKYYVIPQQRTVYLDAITFMREEYGYDLESSPNKKPGVYDVDVAIADGKGDLMLKALNEVNADYSKEKKIRV